MYRTFTAIRHHYRLALMGASALFTAACSQTDALVSDLPAPASDPERVVTLGVAAGDLATRTHLDPDAAATLIPVYWSDGDRIDVNGADSDPLVVGADEKRTSAEFTVRNVEAPYHILYPAGIYCRAADETGRLVAIDIPAEQSYSPTSFGDGSAILYGTVETEGGQAVLTNRCGAIRLSLTDNAQMPGRLQRIVLRSNGAEAPIAGEFTFDLTDGTLTPVADKGVYEVTLALPEEGVTLDASTAQDFYLTIPAGSYPEGFTITIVGDLGRTMECRWLRSAQGAEPGIVVTAGRIVRFASMEFEAKRRITSEEDWNEFAAAVNADDDSWMEEWADQDGVVRIASDITAAELTRIAKEWSGTLDGDGHTITRTEAVHPLFAAVSGTIRNLCLAGAMKPESASDLGSVALVTTLEGGTLENCTNRMDIDFEGAAHVAMAGLVRSFKGGAIRGCVNEGRLSMTVDCSSSGYSACAGGIVATILDLSSEAVIENCVNRGTIDARTDMGGTDNNNGLNCAGFGGIAGWLADGNATHFARFSGCTNSGAVGYTHGSVTKAPAKTLCCGGILGLGVPVASSFAAADPLTETGYYAEFDGCTNEGEIRNGGVSTSSSTAPLTKIYSGGIVGALFGLSEQHAPIRNCLNTGTVRPYEGTYSRAAFSGVAAGLVGLGGYLSIENCEVRATIGTTAAMANAVAGGAGILLTTFSMTGCRIHADLQFIQNAGSTPTQNHYALGVATHSELNSANLSLASSSISGCSFGGTLTIAAATSYTATSWPAPETTDIDAENFGDWILAPAYTGDAIACSGNTFWNGL